MSLQVLYIARHGFRSNWLVDPSTGDYTAFVRSPTGNPADPALTAHGVDQARELAAHLAGLGAEDGSQPAVERIYCSPYYRCLQTVQPFVEGTSRRVRCDPGLVDWFGPAPFAHPQPAAAAVLRDRFFPWIDADYAASGVTAPRQGESMAQLHARVAACLRHVVRQCDAEGVRAALVCAHAAPIIAMGRVLTGRVPADVAAEDFGVFTCGLSVFRRRTQPDGQPQPPLPWDGQGVLAHETWTGGRGIAGGWDCAVNCDCSFLSAGEERGWRFSGDDESFEGPGRPGGPVVDAGLELGVVIQGRQAADQPEQDASEGQNEEKGHSGGNGDGSIHDSGDSSGPRKTTPRL